MKTLQFGIFTFCGFNEEMFNFASFLTVNTNKVKGKFIYQFLISKDDSSNNTITQDLKIG